METPESKEPHVQVNDQSLSTPSLIPLQQPSTDKHVPPRFVVILAVLLVTGFLVYAAMFLMQQNHEIKLQSPDQDRTTQPISGQVDNVKIYRNEKFGFEFTYPTDWKLEEKFDPKLDGADISISRDDLRIELLVSNLPTTSPSDTVEGGSCANGGYHVLACSDKTTSSNLRYARIIESGMSTEETYRAQFLKTYINTQKTSLQFSTPIVGYNGTTVPDAARAESTFDEILSTLKFVSDSTKTDGEQGTAPTNQVPVNWRESATPLSDLNLIGDNDPGSQNPNETKFTYYDMGTHGTSTIIMAVSPDIEAGHSIIRLKFFFEKLGDEYRLMSRMLDAPDYFLGTKGILGYKLGPNVTQADTSTVYVGSVGQQEFTYKNIKFYAFTQPNPILSFGVGEFPDYFRPSSKLLKLGSVGFGDLYVTQVDYQLLQEQTSSLISLEYYVKLPSNLYVQYTYSYRFFTDDSVPHITWNDGTQNTESYSKQARLGGCGGGGAAVIPQSDVSKVIHVTGKTNEGENIYEFNDVHHPVMQRFYELFGGKLLFGENPKELTPEEWSELHPVVLYHDQFGNYVIFTNDKYGIQAECGKPVIYLYPMHDTDISVQVGAHITKSEPMYGNGWQVKASPDGTLTMADGTQYNSLFWEGTGHGTYPVITEGTIVAKDQIEKTLHSQLAELGLTAPESNDFLEFWLTKMPTTPYIRLTWFTTKQMNELAPIFVYPRPDTTIRVFLDFEGLQKPVPLPQQKLSTIPRNGFTLVEWGGLLRK